MEKAVQLTIDGNEEPLGRRPRELSELQLEALKCLEDRPSGMRAVELGVILHKRHGGCPQTGKRWADWRGERAIGCCPYASTDGVAVARRLEARGLVARAGSRWIRIYR
jgi:hypothetical protein